MAKIQIQTLKGFRDFLPAEKRKRDFVLEKIKKGFEIFGFEPLESPAIEYASLLLGKYGEEADRLVYTFKDRGDRKVALRYDQTVPLARIAIQYKDKLSNPFKRYQIQNVWRAEKPQKGRFREFLQCDIDIINNPSLLADTEVIVCAINIAKKLGFKNTKMLINNRREVFGDLSPKYISSIDKLDKIGKQGVISDLIKKGMDKKTAENKINSISNKKPTPDILSLFKYLEKFGLKENKDFVFEPTLARGLDYYTSTIFELTSSDYKSGSLGGGGRYDNLIGSFFNNNVNIPAVGFSFGFDRLIEAIQELDLFPKNMNFSSTQVLVAVFNKEYLGNSIETSTLLRNNKINSEVYLNSATPLDKQLKYADKKAIPWVIIIGPDEAKENKIMLKNLETMKQEKLSLKNAIEKIKKL